MLIATKAGLTRSGPSAWEPDARPEYLRKEALKSCKQLGVEQIGLWQLHRVDPKVPRDEQFGAVKSLLDDGIIRHAGLSNVSVADIEAASKMFKVATVQNRYNLVDRHSEDVLDYCAAHGIGFIPWFPLASGRLAKAGSLLIGRQVTRRHAEPDRACLGAQAKSGHVADSRHVEGGASRGECRRREHRAV